MPEGKSDYVQTLTQGAGQLQEAYRGLEQAMAGVMRQEGLATQGAATVYAGERQDLEGMKGQVSELKKQIPDVPPKTTEPPVPQVALRPFGEGLPGQPPVQTLNNVLMSLGLMAQMGYGIMKNYPQGALAAYTGALRGWQQGDAERAIFQWQQYQQEVAAAQREWAKTKQAFDMTMQKYGANLELLRNQMGILAAEHGLGSKMVDLAFRNPEAAAAHINVLGNALRDTIKGTIDLTTKAVMWEHQQERERIADQHYNQNRDDRLRSLGRLEEQARLANDRINQSMGIQANKAIQPLSVYPMALMEAEKLRMAIGDLQRKGLLAADSSLWGKQVAHLKQVLQPGDPNLIFVQFFEKPLTIGIFDRKVHDEKNARNIQMFQGQLQGLERMPPGGANAVLDQLEDSLKQNYDMQVKLLRNINSDQIQIGLNQLNAAVMGAVPRFGVEAQIQEELRQ